VIKFEVLTNGKKEVVTWEVFVTALNKPYIYCHNTKATAYFVNNGTVFFFTDFYGDKKSFLHYFYLGAHKILLGYYPEIVVKDKLLIDEIFNPFLKAIHDFTAPFFHYYNAFYKLKFNDVDDVHNPNELQMQATCTGKILKKEWVKINFDFTLKDNNIATINIATKNTQIIATQLIDEN